MALLIGAPLLGACVLALPLTARGGRWVREIVTSLALAGALAGLVVTLMTWPVLGEATRASIHLGPLDPSEAAAGTAWSLAPLAMAALFVAIAIRSRSHMLLGLAIGQIIVAGWSATIDLTSGEAASVVASGPLVLDPLAASLLLVSVVVGGLITIYALGYEPDHLEHRGQQPARTATFLAWLLLFVAAMNLLVLADDLRMLAVGWEVTTLCSFVLIGFDGDRPAQVAARRALAYNLLGGIALGLSILLAGPGASLTELVAGGEPARAVLPLILGGCIVAAATKSALLPFHPWLLGAMIAAAPVSGLLHASAMVKAGTYLLLRLAPPIAGDGLLGPALALLGGVTFAVTAFVGLRQRDLKRILALSTISTLGLIAAAAGLGSPAAVAAGALLIVFHAVAKALAFLSVGSIEQVTRTRDLEALVGSLRTAPRLAVPLVVAAVALALPPFGLVVAKWAILQIGARDVVLMVFLAVGGATYLALWTAVVGRLIVRRADAPVPRAALPLRESLPIAVLVVGSIAGLLVAAPVARLLADPAGQVAFGVDPGLAAGWSISLAGGAFAVPIVAALAAAAAAVAVVVARRTGRIAPGPYLSGAGPTRAGVAAFHGALGGPVAVRTAGFYWGVRHGRERAAEKPGPVTPGMAPTARVASPAHPAALDEDGLTGGPWRVMTAAGWLLIAWVCALAAASWLGLGPLP